MLILSRKKGERIVIGGNVTLQIVEVRGDKVRVGIIAPRDVSVHREEIWQQIQAGEPDKKQEQIQEQQIGEV